MACPSSCKDTDCTLTYRQHLLGIGVAPSATPTRGKGWHASQVNAKEKAWERDLPAYKALRKDGLQPPKIDGSADLQAKATDAGHVTTGMTNIKPRAFEAFRSEFGHDATTPVT